MLSHMGEHSPIWERTSQIERAPLLFKGNLVCRIDWDGLENADLLCLHEIAKSLELQRLFQHLYSKVQPCNKQKTWEF